MRTAKALVRLRGCAGSPEPSLVAYVISIIISSAVSIYKIDKINSFCQPHAPVRKFHILVADKAITEKYGTPEETFSFLFLSCAHKLLTRFNNIITRLNDLLCRMHKLFILFQKYNTEPRKAHFLSFSYLVRTSYKLLLTI